MIRFITVLKYCTSKIFPLCFIVFILCCNHVNAENSKLNLNDFIKAAINTNFLEMEKLLNKGADINYVDKVTKLSALSYASYSNNIKVVDFLVKNGANIEGDSKYPNNPIYFATLNNNVDIVELLINNGVDPNYAWEDRGGTLLTQAVQMGKLEVVKVLLRYGANVNYCGNGKHSPLFRSIIYGRNDMMEYLLNKGAMLNKNDKFILDELKWFNNEGNEKIYNILKLKSIY